ncbi:tyrosine-type recombinase/integrase [Pleurocapsa sp. PCC 7319]|uniref:tyrosine-type recombinase/integrase n=1 Tax=Pleurocapsa sp. PCC 7319 TaxID=118161 RepID=UPI000371F423|nr:tyrosine-type recombinase/integrase [Pleurocapsa sp. PCC 7319]
MPIIKRNYHYPGSSHKPPQLSRSNSKTKFKALTLPTTEAMKQCFRRYLELEVANGNACPDTVVTYQRRIDRYLIWCSDRNLSPALVSREEILIYRRYLIEVRQLKSSTIALALVVMRSFYHACLQQNLIKENPVVGVNPPRAKVDVVEQITFLTLEQLQHLLSLISNDNSVKSLRDRFLLSLMALEGLRTVELNRANLGNIRGSKSSTCSLSVEGKGKIRTVPLRSDLAELMWRYLEARLVAGEQQTPNSSLFISLSNRFYGRRLSRRGIRYIVDGYLELARLKEIDSESSRSCHSLRHTAGTLGLAGGASLRQVQELLGHSDPKTTAIYAHVLERHENNPALCIDVKI